MDKKFQASHLEFIKNLLSDNYFAVKLATIFMSDDVRVDYKVTFKFVHA